MDTDTRVVEAWDEGRGGLREVNGGERDICNTFSNNDFYKIKRKFILDLFSLRYQTSKKRY